MYLNDSATVQLTTLKHCGSITLSTNNNGRLSASLSENTSELFSFSLYFDARAFYQGWKTKAGSNYAALRSFNPSTFQQLGLSIRKVECVIIVIIFSKLSPPVSISQETHAVIGSEGMVASDPFPSSAGTTEKTQRFTNTLSCCSCAVTYENEMKTMRILLLTVQECVLFCTQPTSGKFVENLTVA